MSFEMWFAILVLKAVMWSTLALRVKYFYKTPITVEVKNG
jgi:hypothetical protein